MDTSGIASMNYPTSGVIGSMFALVVTQPERMLDALILGACGAVGALIARFLWGLGERLIQSKRNSKEK